MMCTCCCCVDEFLCDVKRVPFFSVCSKPFLCASSLIHKISMSANMFQTWHVNHPNSRKPSRLSLLWRTRALRHIFSSGNSVGIFFWVGENITLSKVVGDLHLRNRKVTAVSSRGRLWLLLFLPHGRCLMSIQAEASQRWRQKGAVQGDATWQRSREARARFPNRTERPNGLGFLWIFGVRSR